MSRYDEKTTVFFSANAFIAIASAITLILFFAAIFAAERWWHIQIESNRVVVTVNGKEVYRGASYGCQLHSVGSASYVCIYGEGFFAITQQAEYCGKVELEPAN